MKQIEEINIQLKKRQKHYDNWDKIDDNSPIKEMFDREGYKDYFIEVKKNQLVILEKRIKSFAYLDSIEKSFLEDPFPILFRINL